MSQSLDEHSEITEAIRSGDVIIIPEIGAYSIAKANHINGITPASIIDLENIPETQRPLA